MVKDLPDPKKREDFNINNNALTIGKAFNKKR
jgi:hypothetical protein